LGGASKNADLNSINLAQRLKDGEQILVRAKGEALPTATFGGASGKASRASAKLPSRPVNVNTAGDAELQTLPGIGPATSEQILKTRTKKRFRSLDDLDAVKGLGPKKMEKLKPYVTF
jgi:competence protein ComEA